MTQEGPLWRGRYPLNFMRNFPQYAAPRSEEEPTYAQKTQICISVTYRLGARYFTSIGPPIALDFTSPNVDAWPKLIAPGVKAISSKNADF